MCRGIWVQVVVIVGILAPASPMEARFTVSWTKEDLFREADVIVEACPTRSDRSLDRIADESWPYSIVGIETKFRIEKTIKGKVNGNELVLYHFGFGELKPGQRELLIDGPLFADFSTELKPGPTASRTLRLYLTRRKDGRFEPVSGQIDAQLSIQPVDSNVRRK